jgi:CelD/BcsL family acetyltransferase involved in cellulose biosynthesis
LCCAARIRIDRPIAMQLCAECGGQYCIFTIGFNEEFACGSPGTLLMLRMVSWAAGVRCGP